MDARSRFNAKLWRPVLIVSMIDNLGGKAITRIRFQKFQQLGT